MANGKRRPMFRPQRWRVDMVYGASSWAGFIVQWGLAAIAAAAVALWALNLPPFAPSGTRAPISDKQPAGSDNATFAPDSDADVAPDLNATQDTLNLDQLRGYLKNAQGDRAGEARGDQRPDRQGARRFRYGAGGPVRALRARRERRGTQRPGLVYRSPARGMRVDHAVPERVSADHRHGGVARLVPDGRAPGAAGGGRRLAWLARLSHACRLSLPLRLPSRLIRCWIGSPRWSSCSPARRSRC